MAESQIVGTSQKLGTKPISSPSANPRMGEVQSVGETVPLNRTPVASPSANPKSGQIQSPSETVPLNRTPVKGFGTAANLPMSERAIAQSATGKKGKR